MRVMMYSPDSIGLGHMRRNSTIAAEIIRANPTASVALLVGSGAGAFFSLPKGIDTIKLPSVQKVASEKWVARTLNITAHETCAMRGRIIKDVVHDLKPDVFLADHLPLGVGGELKPALQMIRERGLPTRTVLGLRDILDEPAIIKKRWHQQGFYKTIAECYDRVFIYGEEDIWPSARHYSIDDALPGGVEYVGFVCTAAGNGRQTQGRAVSPKSMDGLAHWQPGEKIIVATGGGGHDAFPMLSDTVAALRSIDEKPGHRAIVIAGPLMPSEHRDNLAEEVKGLQRTSFLPWTADCMDYISLADVAVVMAGYNSSLEALGSLARVIMIPRDGPSAEQRIRTTMLSERGLVTSVLPEQASPEAVGAALQQALSAPPRKPNAVSLTGAARAARAIQAIATGSERHGPAKVQQDADPNPYVVF